jgi:cytochrome c peroxidase
MKKATAISLIFFAFIFVFNFACQKAADGSNNPPQVVLSDTLNLPTTPYDYASLGSMPAYIKNYLAAHPEVDNTPSDNPITNDGATLGRVLFYDRALSINNKTACSSCHQQDKAFTDGMITSKGFADAHTRRNAMPIFNQRYFKGKAMFWDLRASSLEEQVLKPITDPVEMGMSSLSALTTKLNTLSYYPPLFQRAFGSPVISSDRIAKALAQFVRSITSFNSKYDQGLDNNFSNFSPDELKGKQLIAQLNCIECHSDLSNVRTTSNPDPKPTFLLVENTGENLFGTGTNNGLDLNYTDNGIGERTGQAKDMATFKMPSLRNIALTAPYMHDGRFATLEAVINHYQTGVQNHPNKGVQIPNGGYTFLTDADKAAIIAFLKTLSDQSLLTDVKYSTPFK